METKLELMYIRTDGGTQPRAAINPAVVAEYKEEMHRGDKFPPVVVFHDGDCYWLADGFHRVRAAVDSGRKYIQADVRQGTQREAILHSVGANQSHGTRRTNADKRRAVERLLRDEEWAQWSDNAIAQQCGVSNHLVAEMRSDSTWNSPSDPTPTTPRQAEPAPGNKLPPRPLPVPAPLPVRVLRRTSDGRVINTANIGRGGLEPGIYREEGSNVTSTVSIPRHLQKKGKPGKPAPAPVAPAPFEALHHTRQVRCPHCGKAFGIRAEGGDEE